MKRINMVQLRSLFKMNARAFGILFSLLILLSVGCKRKYPGDILTPEEMKPILFDVMMATQVKQMDTSAVTKLHIRDSITYEIHRVLAAHQVDDSLYFRSMAYYEAHPDYLKALLDSTKVYGNILQDSLQKQSFTTPDSLHGQAVRPNFIKKLNKPAVTAPNVPVNPTVKDSAVHPVIKVKKSLKK